MKNILFLMTDISFFDRFFQPIADALLARGNIVRAVCSLPFAEMEPEYDLRHCRWDIFEYSQIENFKPDTIIVFNGYHDSISASVKYLKLEYNLFHCELGWLPQRDHLYLDTDMGYGGEISKGFVYHYGFTPSPEQEAQLKSLELIYEVKDDLDSLPKEFALIPLQLEHDVSIIKDSPYFKLMAGLVGFVRSQLPSAIILIKPHPLSSNEYQEDWKRLVIDKRMQVIGKEIKTVDIASKASIVIGLNSTALIESLVHHVFVVFLADGVLGKNDCTHLFTDNSLAKLYEKLLKNSFNPCKDLHIQQLLYLCQNQFSKTGPTPDWIVDKIENYIITPRTLGGLDGKCS